MRRIQVSAIAVKKIAMVFLVVTAWLAIAQMSRHLIRTWPRLTSI